MNGARSARAVFCDRDGTLIEDTGYPRDPDLVTLLPGATDALARLREAGFLIVVISNQSGIGRGLISPDEAEAVHARFTELLAEQGIELDGAKYCPHVPGTGCDCRKPSPGLIVEAARELGIDLGASFMIGDKQTDVEAGRNAGCCTVRLGHEETPAAAASDGADFTAHDWPSALGFILGAGVPA